MKANKSLITENLTITTANALKRAGALLLDLVIMYIIMNLFWFGVHPIINHIHGYDAAVSENNRDMKRSYLVTLSAPLASDESNIDEVTITANTIETTKRAEATYKFYTLFVNSEVSDPSDLITDEWFAEHIYRINDENSLFVKVNPQTNPKLYSSVTSAPSEEPPAFDPFLVPGYTYKSETPDPEVMNRFYSSIYQEAINLYNKRPLVKKINDVVMLENTLLIVLSTSVVFLALPLFLKHGQTLGKKVFKLGLATKHGYRVGALFILLRYFAFLIINILSNLLIPIIFPFVSLTVMVFNKKGRSLHDLIAGTRVVDLNKSVIYDNEDAYTEAQAQQAVVRDDSYNEEVFADRFDEGSGA